MKANSLLQSRFRMSSRAQRGICFSLGANEEADSSPPWAVRNDNSNFFQQSVARAIATRTSSAWRLGKSARISSIVSPAARLESTVRRVTRVSLKTGSPPHIAGSRTILSSLFCMSGPASLCFSSIYHSTIGCVRLRSAESLAHEDSSASESICVSLIRNG